MKKIIRSVLLPTSILLLIFSCSNPQQKIYERLMEHANSVKVINTHEHQRDPQEMPYRKFHFWVLLNHSYLMADVASAGGTYFGTELLNNGSLDTMWQINGKYLDYSANTSYYKHFLEGLRKCYGYNEPVFSKEGIEQLSKQIAENYRNYDAWFDSCFQKANFETMLLDQYWAPFNMAIDEKHFKLIFQVNKLVYDIGNAKNIYNSEHELFGIFAAHTGIISLQTLNDYLDFAGFLLQSAVSQGAVGLKNSMAYGRSLDYENVPEERAAELFRKSPAITEAESKELQDFMFHWFCKKAAEYNIPVQIHTGYLAGNGNRLDNGNPVKLNTLFLQHPDTRFDLFHGGFPWTGEFMALGKMFPNVYLNLVWLPQISKKRALITFDEMLDCVPYDKFLWGGDCHFIEETVGSLEFGKQVVCEVLAARVASGDMDETTAKKIISAVFRENAIRIFNLNEQPGKISE